MVPTSKRYSRNSLSIRPTLSRLHRDDYPYRVVHWYRAARGIAERQGYDSAETLGYYRTEADAQAAIDRMALD